MTITLEIFKFKMADGRLIGKYTFRTLADLNALVRIFQAYSL